ncbi:MAG: hypothetical protein R3D60_10150 [Paracoccaceae bacterium]
MKLTWAEFKARGLTKAEEKLEKAYAAGRPCVLSVRRPEAAEPDCAIRAEFLRFLILGYCNEGQVPKQGVRLSGAFIEGVLDISFSTVQGPIVLKRCNLSGGLIAKQSTLEMLRLDGSVVGHLDADSAVLRGHAMMRYGFECHGSLRLSGATIGGVLNCDGGSFFANSSGEAIVAEQLKATRWRVFTTWFSCLR